MFELTGSLTRNTTLATWIVQEAMALITKIEEGNLDRIHGTPGTVFRSERNYRRRQETGGFALNSVCGAKTYKLIRNLVNPRKPTNKSFAELVNLVK